MIVDEKHYESNLQQICELFYKSFHIRLGESFFRWRYIDNPFNKIFVSFKYLDDKLIGNYSANPCVLYYNGIKNYAGLSMTTMTDPDYCGRGIFTELAKELYKYMDSNGLKCVFGFPNQNSHTAFIRKLGWTDIYEIPTMLLNINAIDMNNVFVEDNFIHEDNNFDLDYSATQDYPIYIFVKKNKDYLKWRYRDNPLNEYQNFVIHNNNKVSSYCIIKHYNKGKAIDLVDMQPNNEGEARTLILFIIDYAIQNKINYIFTWVPARFYTRHIFEEIGFVDTKPVTFFGGRNFDKQDKTLPIERFSSWYIQMGDSDVY